ncbi:MAG: hypothetical protein A2X12_01145 [Bacteroidetes bacterium GWE2_29_8]|nr:MAG: hypothetical protein A2X12_01145 [Bacteroidetes bacterium GWE2_29_8]OFY14417.1 MAG: hypothetical protein A2X02_01280 [Bacteroidetes bacterium GWF2_29_10]
MGLFQNTVISKYLKSLDKQKLSIAYTKFKDHFFNPIVQENIRNSKEEQYQEGFFNDLFVNILGYIKNPTPNFNITTEYKNVKDSKKADGAIIINEKVIAVIELKGTDATDLNKVEEQAFGYKNNQPECVYIITSNFEKLRIYIENATEHIEFNLFKISETEFQLLYLCLSYDSIKNDVPRKIKIESLSQEDIVTKKLYNDYSLFKRELYQNLISLNTQYNTLTLFNKSQKLLDRFLFLFFAEDRALLPPNSVRLILSDWKDLQERDAYVPLYDRFKQYFGYLNTGESKRYVVYAYNGGLFKEDVILDSVKIDDDLLYKHTLKLSEYDFNSEIDVNILGHIFENSLNELDEIKAQIEGQSIDKTKSKRKKDGVFYTPKYITKYIVDNTVGKLCNEKKIELQINEQEYITNKKRKKNITQLLLDKLNTYRDWLLQITICDPACGSGAFLNQALDFLIAEHHYMDELQAKLLGESIVFNDIENSILENNLFGVDINEESVEIAKLSLWLRTAQPKRKLNDLSNNIKCGNSLIDDPLVAGEKAFNWKIEFPQVFNSFKYAEKHKNYAIDKDIIASGVLNYPDQGDYDYKDELCEPISHYGLNNKTHNKHGFDIVIGNPPYVQLQSLKQLSKDLRKLEYVTYEKTTDLYCLFYELGRKILKQNGLLGFITSNKWMRANYGKALRQYITSNTSPYMLINLGAGVFEGATVDSNILLFNNKIEKIEKPFSAIDLSKEKRINDFSLFEYKKNKINPKGDEIWIIGNDFEQGIKTKIERIGKPLKEWNISINYGIKTGFNEAFVIDKTTKENLIKEDSKSAEILVPVLRGRDIKRYLIEYADLWLINIHNGYKSTHKIDVNDYPAIKNHLTKYWKQICKRYDKGDTPYNLRNCAYIDEFYKEKIIYQEIVQQGEFLIDNANYFCIDTGRIIIGDNLKFLTCLFNSKLFFYSIKNYYGGGGLGEKGIRMKHTFFINFPGVLPENQQPFIEKADLMLSLNKELQEMSLRFQRSIQRKFEIEDLSQKLQNWYLLTYPEFTKELTKKKIKLSLSQEAEWEDYFIQETKKALDIKHKIDITDKEIDQMVYVLYELTEDEIKIVEV